MMPAKNRARSCQTVVVLPEEVDLTNAGEAREQLAAAIAGNTTVIADMSATTFCACAGGRVIVQAHQQAVARGGNLRVVVTEALVRRLFIRLQLCRVLDLYPSVDAAMTGPPASRAVPGIKADGPDKPPAPAPASLPA